MSSRPHSTSANLDHEGPAGQLTLVATPIGNRSDISLRALEVLRAADIILCEDTRHSGPLLQFYDITAKRMSLHEHNEQTRAETVMAMLREGKNIALISDAGTPAIADPGERLVAHLRAAGFNISIVPGANAMIAALALSGLPAIPFMFLGFLSPKAKARQAELQACQKFNGTLICYEAPHRIHDLVSDVQTCLKGRQIVLVRELTKKFEEVISVTVDTALTDIPERGEYVVLIGPPTLTVSEDWPTALALALQQHPLKTAVQLIAGSYHLPRQEVYQAALKLKATLSLALDK